MQLGRGGQQPHHIPFLSSSHLRTPRRWHASTPRRFVFFCCCWPPSSPGSLPLVRAPQPTRDVVRMRADGRLTSAHCHLRSRGRGGAAALLPARRRRCGGVCSACRPAARAARDADRPHRSALPADYAAYDGCRAPGEECLGTPHCCPGLLCGWGVPPGLSGRAGICEWRGRARYLGDGEPTALRSD